MSEICKGGCNGPYRRAKAIFDAASAAHAKLIAALPEGAEHPPAPMMPPDVKPWWGQPVFCGKCSSRIRQALAELDDLAALRISQYPAGQRGQAADERAGRITGSTAPGSPSPAMDDIDELAGHLRDWEAVGRGLEQAVPRRGYLASQLTTVVAWLYHHFDPMIANPDYGADYGADVLRWHRELEGKTKAGTGMKHLKRPCPRCRLHTLWERSGDTYVSCINEDCGRRMTRAEYDALTEVA